jgi:hypothetical protein
MNQPKEQTPSKLAKGPQEGGDIRSQRWEWVEPEVWTERMLAALETGIEGGKWFRLIDKVWGKKNLSRALEKRTRRRGKGQGRDHQKWPNAHFTAMGLISLKQAHQAACRSL